MRPHQRVGAAGVFTLWHDMRRKPETVILRIGHLNLTVEEVCSQNHRKGVRDSVNQE
jgi:hypothetical protein